MKKFNKITAVAAPLPLINVDTDMIIPARFLKTIKRTGLGQSLFHTLRFDENGSERKDFVLNKSAYKDAKILIAGANFGCGSSREHAPWALDDFGIRCVIAPDFADIFFNNCGNNQMLAITLPAQTLEELFVLSEQHDDIHIDVDLENQLLTSNKFAPIRFDIRKDVKERLLSGLDFIGVTETLNPQIDAFEKQLAAERPWQ